MIEIIKHWCEDWGIPRSAFTDLLQRLGTTTTPELPIVGTSEEANKSRVRLAASAAGWMLWRNNTGVAFDDRGRAVRFGLCNDSAKLNARVKSSDLIGIKPGGQFVAREVKRGNWVWRGTPAEQAQQRFLDLVNALGGDAKFTKGDLLA